MAMSPKPRPSRITTPGTPPSRTIRLEPRPMTVTGISAGRLAQKIGQIVFVLRHEQNLRRAADAEPGQLGERLVGQQPPAQFRHFCFQIGARYRESSCGCSRHSIEPGRQHVASKFARSPRPSARPASRSSRGSIPGLAELDGVADEPAFEARRLGLEVKLQARAATACGESLHRTMRRRREHVRIPPAGRNCRRASAAPAWCRAAPAPKLGRPPSTSVAPSRSP